MLDSTGEVLEKSDYSLWGVPIVTNYSGCGGSPDISHTGKKQDATKLYYFNARYYDASIGRFITEDPARNGMNWFVYCENNPLKFTDPSGLDVGNPGNDGLDEDGNPDKVHDYKIKETDDGFIIKIKTGVGRMMNERQVKAMEDSAETGFPGIAKTKKTATKIKINNNGTFNATTKTKTGHGVLVPLEVIGGTGCFNKQKHK